MTARRRHASTESGASAPRPALVAAGAVGAVALGHYLPSVCVLGQWWPAARRALPDGWCRVRGPADRPRLALTFDDGPSPGHTPRTLDLLDELGLRATFFVLGSLAEAHPELVSEIVRRGHTIGSHGHRHEHHLLRTPGWITRDFVAAESALERIGVRPRWFRPPYGQLTAWTAVEARRRSMEIVLWSRWGREWAETSPGTIAARLLGGAVPGAILLLHDTDESCPVGTAARTHEVVRLVGAALADHGLEAVTLDTLVDRVDDPATTTGTLG